MTALTDAKRSALDLVLSWAVLLLSLTFVMAVTIYA